MGGIVGLGGGIGASRLWVALASAVGQGALTLIVNTGDDLWTHGLRVCPDLDTVRYRLSGQGDAQRGWGLRGETFRVMDQLRELGEDVWFNLGDRDLGTHLLRTGWLAEGLGLNAVTARLTAASGVGARLLPMTEQEVTTRVVVPGHRSLHYEEFLVKHGAALTVQHVCYDGIEDAEPAPGVIDAIRDADLVVLAPSNPLASMLPILGVRGVRDALVGAPVVAVTPIVRGIPIRDPGEQRRAHSRAALLASRGLPATAYTVAELYRDFCDRFVVDSADVDELAAIGRLGIEAVAAPTLLSGTRRDRALVDTVLSFAQLPVEVP
ncbi:2-phospho-L-lactate transferase [Actinophytocola sp.]|uniref:2-phospho-L-lactate transferase n=1 Tax=Actinophytocola sp. TaxID=1872138 RepID=UPI002ED5F30E